MTPAPSPTGEQLVDELRRAAEQRGMLLGAFLAPLTAKPRNYLNQLRRARTPKTATIERITALIEGREVAAPTGNNFQFAGGTPGSVNHANSGYSLHRTLEAKARLEVRQHLSEQARSQRRPGETLASAVLRVEQEARP